MKEPARIGWARALAASLLPWLALSCSRTGGVDFLVTGPPPLPRDRPIEHPGGRFATSDACQACHPREYETWHSSFHRTMTQEVSPETVLAPWEGELTHHGERFRLERRGDEFWVEMNDPEVKPGSTEWADGPPRVWRQVVLSTGAHNFQAYWFPSGFSRKLYLFVLVYRVDEGRWMPMDSIFIEPPSIERKAKLPRWNLVCLRCHTTDPRSRVESMDQMDTLVAEFGIACEACHGPAAEHVAANENPLRRYRLHLGDEHDLTIVNPVHLSAERSAEVCGQCHGITEMKPEFADFANMHGFSFEPGKSLLARRDLTIDGDQAFWKDGQVRVSGREYNGLVCSPCFLKGEGERKMTCTSCHKMHREDDDARSLEEWRVHQVKPGFREDVGCVQCHEEYRDEERRAQHTHHAAGSTTCYDCHMPRTVWGLLKGIRSHTITSPSVQESVELGRPNACNLCHLDQTLAWTGAKLEDWYESPAPALSSEQSSTAAAVLWSLTGDAGLRALTAWHMGWDSARSIAGEDWLAPYLATLLDDPYDAVRFRAGRSLRSLSGFEDFAYDSSADPAQLREARSRALERWKSRPSRRDDARLLIEGGQLDEAAFQAFLSRRDQKEMTLAE